jgi:hypothetical protein
VSYYELLNQAERKEERRMKEQANKIGQALKGQLYQGTEYILKTINQREVRYDDH